MKRRGNYFLKNRKKGFFLLLKKDFRPRAPRSDAASRAPGEGEGQDPPYPLDAPENGEKKGFFRRSLSPVRGRRRQRSPGTPRSRPGPPGHPRSPLTDSAAASCSSTASAQESVAMAGPGGRWHRGSPGAAAMAPGAGIAPAPPAVTAPARREPRPRNRRSGSGAFRGHKALFNRGCWAGAGAS